MSRRDHGCGRLAAVLLVLAAFASGSARAEQAWIKDEVRLNIRTGPGVEFRILGGLKTGDQVRILQRKKGWTQVKPAMGEAGWIPVGYLKPDAPARVLMAQRVRENADLKQRLESLTRDEDAIRRENESLIARDEKQRSDIARITQDNMKLRAGARWPEWIAGASLLGVGMLLGALLRGTNRRQTPRIRF